VDEELKKLQDAIEEKLKLAASKTDLETIKSEMATEISKIKVGVSEDELKAAQNEFNEKLKAQWTEVEKKLKSTEQVKPIGLIGQIKQAFVDAGLIEQVNEGGVNIERVKFGKPYGHGKESAEHLKVAVDMNTASFEASVAAGYITNYGMLPQELPLTTDQHLLNVFGGQQLAPIQSHFAVVVEGTETDGSALKTETGVAGDSSFLMSTVDFKVFDFATKFRIHQNMLNNWVNLATRIQTIGFDRLSSKIDYYAIASGGNNTTIPYGISDTGYHTNYDTTLRANEVKSANIVDVIKNGVLQVELLDKSVNAIMLNPNDIAYIESLKDGDSNQVRLAGLVVDSTGRLAYIYGLRVIKTKKVTANSFFLVNTFESIQFGNKNNFGVRMGYDVTTDFSKNIVTIQLEASVAIGIGNAETIIYCSDITAAETALTAV
jgi:hypothetical protein